MANTLIVTLENDAATVATLLEKGAVVVADDASEIVQRFFSYFGPAEIKSLLGDLLGAAQTATANGIKAAETQISGEVVTQTETNAINAAQDALAASAADAALVGVTDAPAAVEAPAALTAEG